MSHICVVHQISQEHKMVLFEDPMYWKIAPKDQVRL